MATKGQTLDKKIVYTPTLYKVVLHNDDVTTMDFVVAILQDIFDKSYDEAIEKMLEIHNEGSGVCGIYTKEIAKTKQDIVLKSANLANFPLKCTIEKD